MGKMIGEEVFNNENKNHAGVSVKEVLLNDVMLLHHKLEELSKNRGQNSQDISTVLQNLNKEYNNLSKRVNALTMSPKNERKKNFFLINKSTSTSQDDISDIFNANETIAECLMGITAVNHYVNTTRDKSELLKEKFTHGSSDVAIQDVSIGLMHFQPTREKKLNDKENHTVFRKLGGASLKVNPTTSLPSQQDSEKWYYLCCFGGLKLCNKNNSETNPRRKRSFMVTHSRRLTPSLASINTQNST